MFIHLSGHVKCHNTDMSAASVIAEQHCGSRKAFFSGLYTSYCLCLKAKAVSLSQIRTYRDKITKTADIEYPQTDKLTGERNSRTMVSLWLFLETAYYCQWCQIMLALSVQQWHVTLIRKNIDRKAVSKRERERWERGWGKRGTEWAGRKSQTAAETQRQRSKKKQGKKWRESIEERVGGGSNSETKNTERRGNNSLK